MSQVAIGQVKQALGAPVSDFSLTSVDDARSSLKAYLEGKKGAVVLFWSGVCSHCGRYDQYLNSFASQHPEIGFVAIASRQDETPEEIRATIAERKLTFPILLDPGSRVAQQWYAQQTPRAFLIDAGRILLYRGAIDNFRYSDDGEYVAYLEPAISQFLAGAPVARGETPSFGCDIRSVYYSLPKML